MIKYFIKILLVFFFPLFIKAQQNYIDSLQQEINTTKNDTLKLILYGKLSNAFTEISPDSAYYNSDKMLSLANKLNLPLEAAHALAEMGYALVNMSNYPRSLQTFLSALSLGDDPKSEANILPDRFPKTDEFTDRDVSPHLQRLNILGRIHQYLGILYGNANNYEKAILHYQLSLDAVRQTGNLRILSIIDGTLGRTYLAINKPDSALIHEQKAYDEATQIGYTKYTGSFLLNLGRIYLAQGAHEKGKEYLRKAIVASTEQKYFRGIVASDLALADVFKQSGEKDSVFYYIQAALPISNYLNAPDLLLRSYAALADYYKSINNSDSTVKYQALIIKINDSQFSAKQAQQFQNIDFDELQRQQQIEDAKSAYRIKFRMYALLAGIVIFLLIAIILWRNNRHRQRAYTLLKNQKQEIDFQKSKVEQALIELKSAQAQLIQSEKMASLGELTAGIAHEIQNPLNFVNNFSEVNKELLEEMNEEIIKGNYDEVKAIAKDVSDNQEKINFHGKRADSIVKGMLLHSRDSSRQKEPVDINDLADECLRLSYHGMRAKDKSLNVKTETDFDNNIPPINIISQDIGRVILNLFTNAFYSVMQKKEQVGEGFEPVVSVKTSRTTKDVSISIKDNGNGVPQKVVDKIFQPFFTTKPAGQGTGLGLSMSYDIIIKGHGGELKVETKEGEYAEFIIILPV